MWKARRGACQRTTATTDLILRKVKNNRFVIKCKILNICSDRYGPFQFAFLSGSPIRPKFEFEIVKYT